VQKPWSVVISHWSVVVCGIQADRGHGLADPPTHLHSTILEPWNNPCESVLNSFQQSLAGRIGRVGGPDAAHGPPVGQHCSSN